MGELDIWGEPPLGVSDKVKLKRGDGSTAIIERLGTNKGVYRVEPALSGYNWHVEQELERVP